ncbi:hypothetical protein VNO77_27835 [Canavalia gladiata]|uniref:Apple domain-containing protein n=1 Tax=Canavalia gladiata TaxID=3824 RepID=A0AAN9Q6V3_CANGL
MNTHNRTIATLLDSGNFVPREINANGSTKFVLWQSFEDPSSILADACYGYNIEGGCQRWEQPTCRHPGDIFDVRSGYFDHSSVTDGGFVATDNNVSLGAADCKAACWTNCSCVEFTAIFSNGTGCQYYHGTWEPAYVYSADVSVNILTWKKTDQRGLGAMATRSGLELVDPTIRDSCILDQALRCIHVGLLSAEEKAVDRPTISDIINMLTSEYASLPLPRRRAFYSGTKPNEECISTNGSEPYSVNGLSISNLGVR